jgi:hypothetical protein
VNGICDAFELDYQEKMSLMLLLGPQSMETISGDIVWTKRGAMMGLPLTWPILSLLNLWAWEEGGNPFDRTAAVICGDDLAAIASGSACDRYEDNLKKIGLVLSEEKTFRSKSHFLFTEELYRLDRHFLAPELVPQRLEGIRSFLEDALPYHLRTKLIDHISIIKVKRIRISTLLQAKHADEKARLKTNLPHWATLADCLTSLSQSVSRVSQKQLMRVAFKIHAIPINILLKAKIPLFLPKCLGGAGFPGKIKGLTVSQRRYALSVLSGSCKPLPNWIWEQLILCRNMEDCKSELRSFRRESYRHRREPAEHPHWPDFDEIVSEETVSIISSYTSDLYHYDKRPQLKRFRSVRSLSKQIRQFVDVGLKKVFWARTPSITALRQLYQEFKLKKWVIDPSIIDLVSQERTRFILTSFGSQPKVEISRVAKLLLRPTREKTLVN